MLMISLPTATLPAATGGAQPIVPSPPPPASVTNLLTNGSFELGLGAEPFYPGWRTTKASLPYDKTPSLPVLDSSVFHSGRQSLRLSRAEGKGIAYLDMQSPLLPPNSATWFSFWAKAGRTGVKLLAGICPPDGKGRTPTAPRLLHGDLSTEWQRWQCELPARSGVVPLRLEFSSDRKEPFAVWIDDVSWTLEKPSAPDAGARPRVRAGAVEMVLLPATRNGIHFADKPVALRWSADADRERKVALALKLTDLTRRSDAVVAWSGEAALAPLARQGKIVLPDLKRGAWLAELEARDPGSRALLGVGRERFTVMTDLRGVPPPVDFAAGYHGGIEYGEEIGFNWRGHWSLDEFYATNFQTGFRVQRDIWDWDKIEPDKGRFVWDLMDARIEAAHRNGGTTIICAPHKPLNLPRDKYKAILDNPDAGEGRWLYKTGVDISEHGVRSTPMGSSADPAKRNILLAADPDALAGFMAAVAARYQDKIDAIEFINEANLFITPKGLIDHYLKPAYPAIKRAAPTLPVLMNQTADFSADGNGYTGQFLKLGGPGYCDGVFYHPYGVSLLAKRGLRAAKALEQLAADYSTPDKKLLLGMSEIHGLHEISREFARGEVVQRALLDWSVGCRWSAGVMLTRNTFYEGSGPRHWFLRGPFVPGVGAVHMNALHATLGGYRSLGRIELDDNVLIMRFEKPDAKPGEERYAVAITAAQFPLKTVVLEADLRGVGLTAFDPFGEPVTLPSPERLHLPGMDAIYLRSNDLSLFERLRAGRIIWGQNFAGEVEEISGDEAEAVIYATGAPPRKPRTCGVLTRWTLLDKAHAQTDHPLPYVVLSGEPPPEVTWHRARTSIHASQAQEVTLYFNATGPASLCFNGTDNIDFSKQAYGLVGRAWQSFTVKLKEGMNHVLVQVASRGAPCAFALSASKDALNDSPVAVDAEGFIRKWKMVGPWKNPLDREGRFLGNARAFPPEPLPDFLLHARGLREMPLIWHEASFATPVIPHPWVDGVSYAFAQVEVGEDTRCLASLGSDDGFALWINGVLAGRNATSRSLKMDEEKIPVLLKKGRNQVLFKIDDTGGGGGFALRFLHEDGRPVALMVGK